MIRIGEAVIFTPDDCAPWLATSAENVSQYNGFATERDQGVVSAGYASCRVASIERRYPHDVDIVAAAVRRLHGELGDALDRVRLRIHVLPYEVAPSFNGTTWCN